MALVSCLHFHAIVTDGVFHPAAGGGVAFRVVDPPTDRELGRLVRLVARRIGRTLERHGYTADTLPDDGNDHAWMVAVAASDQGTLRLRGLDEPAVVAGPRLCADFAGYNLHCRTTVAANDSDALQRLCRYILRPPIAADRLLERSDGTYVYEIKKAWRDGTTAIYLDPMALMTRLAALIVRPHYNMVRYFGCYASRSALRPAVVPPPPSLAPDQSDAPPPAARYIPWAALLRRVFGPTAYPLVCPKCGGGMKIIACVDDPTAILQILRHLGLPTTPVVAAPARAPPDLYDDP